MVKMIRTPRKINAILLNIKITQPKLVDICGYELATNQQNFTEIHLVQVKIWQKVLGGATFLTHTVHVQSCTYHMRQNKPNVSKSPAYRENILLCIGY